MEAEQITKLSCAVWTEHEYNKVSLFLSICIAYLARFNQWRRTSYLFIGRGREGVESNDLPKESDRTVSLATET